MLHKAFLTIPHVYFIIQSFCYLQLLVVAHPSWSNMIAAILPENEAGMVDWTPAIGVRLELQMTVGEQLSRCQMLDNICQNTPYEGEE